MSANVRILEHRPDGVLVVQRGLIVVEIARDGGIAWRRVPIWTWLADWWRRRR